jgi:hypothetical protein
MKHLIASVALIALLAACSPQQQQAATTITQAVASQTSNILPPSTVSEIDGVCQAATPLLNAASAVPNQTVAQTATYPQAYCAQLLGSSSTPTTTTATTPTWLTGAISATETAAQIAGIVLPLLGVAL